MRSHQEDNVKEMNAALIYRQAVMNRAMARYLSKVIGLHGAWSRLGDLSEFSAGRSQAISLIEHFDRTSRRVLPELFEDDLDDSQTVVEHTLVGGVVRAPGHTAWRAPGPGNRR